MGKLIDNRYNIIEKIGEGGMGAVYLAEDIRLERRVALKRLQVMGKPSDLEQFQQRFEREAKVMARFHHPNIVSVHDYGQDDEGVYLVLEYMPGGSLAQRMRERQLSLEEIIQILLPLTSALQLIHQSGSVHRDIKPANVLFDGLGNPKLADFGVVKLLETKEEFTLTTAGAAVGTPAYMAPEQIGGETSPASDQYALGVMLYEMVTGQKPFQGRTPMETLTMQKYEPLPDPHRLNLSLPDWLCEVLRTALSKRVQDRYSDMDAFAQVLRAGTQGGASDEKSEDETALVNPVPLIPSTFAGGKNSSGEDQTALGKSNFYHSPQSNSASYPPQSKKLPGWVLVIGVAVVFIGMVVVAGSILLSLGKHGTGPLAGLATSTYTATSTITSTATPTVTSTVTLTPTSTSTPEPGSVLLREKDNMEMVYVPAGTFTMGLDGGYFDAGPAHQVFLDAYWMDKFEVTNTQYQKCVSAGVCIEPLVSKSFSRFDYYTDDKYKNYPVIHVDWYQAKAYCEWVGGDLPTEAQWENAARGTDGRFYPWGNTTPSCRLANFDAVDGCVGDTSEVGSFPNGTSPYGVMDMAGNVWEWVMDWYDKYYYETSPSENPTGPEEGTYRVIRGQSWAGRETSISAKVFMEMQNRRTKLPDYGDDVTGFRCVVSP